MSGIERDTLAGSVRGGGQGAPRAQEDLEKAYNFDRVDDLSWNLPVAEKRFAIDPLIHRTFLNNALRPSPPLACFRWRN